MIKKKQPGNDKDERLSLKDNKEIAKKKKLKKIALKKLNLGTKPINISPSKYPDFFENTNIGTQIKAKIKIISFVVVVAIIFIILFTLKGKFHKQYSDSNDNKILRDNQKSPVDSNKASPSTSSEGNKTVSSPSVSSKKRHKKSQD